MSTELLPFGPGALLFIACYLGCLILVGYVGYRRRRENSLADFYLAGRGLGFLVLFMTLFATQYSGNTMIGFSGKAYRIGYHWMMSVHFMTAIIVFYLIFAPRLRRLAAERGFVTPADYLADRFRSPALSLTATVIMMYAAANFLLSQLMAMGRAVEGFVPAAGPDSFVYGVAALALIIVVYETLGGLRAVAWTDLIQGFLLFVGFGCLLALVFRQFGWPAEATQQILSGARGIDPAGALPPDGTRSREWLSYVLMVGIGAALYPQAIQRIFAAKSGRDLRISLQIMAFLPLVVTFTALLLGVMALAQFPGLEGSDADRVLPMILARVQQSSAFGYWLVVLLFAAILTAIMSTADSCLLSLSSMFAGDVYARLRPRADQARLTGAGKVFSWLLMGLLVLLAIRLRDTTLIRLLDRKFDLLVQLAPAFFLGLHWRRLRAGPVLAGILAGAALALAFVFAGYPLVGGFHPGLLGLALNLAVAVGFSLRRPDVPDRTNSVKTVDRNARAK